MYCVPKVALAATAAILLPTPAFAYIDPAVGSMMLQGVLGAIAIAGTAWYALRQKVGALFATAKAAISARSSSKK